MVSILSFSAYSANEADRKFKAATIFNLVKYVDFGVNSDINICVVNDEEVLSIVKFFFQKSKSKKISSVKGFKKADSEISQCHVVYIAAENQSTANKTINILNNMNSPVITISNLEGFVTNDEGLVEIFREKGRLRYSINLKRANRENIHINSKLIESAYRIR
jgi:transcriptional regulator